MISQPVLVALFLVALEFSILSLARSPRTAHLFRILPSVFWIYFLPMLCSSLGILDPKSQLYSFATDYLLPASLFLLLVGVDLRIIKKLGAPGIFVFLMGSLGIMVGTVVSFVLFKPWVGGEFWAGFGALSASWTGGSANMIAVKEALGTPDAVYLPMVVVDTVVPYVWMGCLISLSAFQPVLDRWNNSRREVVDQLAERFKNFASFDQVKLKPLSTVGIVLMGVGAMLFARFGAAHIPVIPGVMSAFTWVVVLISFFGLMGSLTPLRNLEKSGSTEIGYALLYFVLTTIGAKASVEHLEQAAVLIPAGFFIIVIHVLFIVAAMRFIRCPTFLAAAASQANIGGVASAPVVAEVYQPGLSAVGLLMAIVGNIIGTYLGILTGYVCRLIGS